MAWFNCKDLQISASTFAVAMCCPGQITHKKLLPEQPEQSPFLPMSCFLHVILMMALANLSIASAHTQPDPCKEGNTDEQSEECLGVSLIQRHANVVSHSRRRKCHKNSDCSSGQTCNKKGVNSCVDNGSYGIGRWCDQDAQCQTGYCAEGGVNKCSEAKHSVPLGGSCVHSSDCVKGPNNEVYICTHDVCSDSGDTPGNPCHTQAGCADEGKD